MKCVIAGSRTIDSYELLQQAFTKCDWYDKITEIVSGTARGVDRLGERLAKERGLELTKFPADWSLGKRAGHIRNKDMARYTDIAIILWDGRSTGTANMIRNMDILDKPCLVFTVSNGELVEI